MLQRVDTNYLPSAHINKVFGKEEEERSRQLLLDEPKSGYKLLTFCSYKSSIWQKRKTIMSDTFWQPKRVDTNYLLAAHINQVFRKEEKQLC